MATILDPEHHKRLIEDMEHVCMTANVPRFYVENSMKGVCGPKEVEWFTNYPTHAGRGTAGLLLAGVPDAETRMMAMTGAFVRQFIDAQLHSLNSIIDREQGAAPPDPTVLLIPNLFVRAYGKSLPAWKIQSVYDLLLSRYTAGKLTVCYVESLPGLADSYGKVFADHLTAHYVAVAA